MFGRSVFTPNRISFLNSRHRINYSSTPRFEFDTEARHCSLVKNGTIQELHVCNYLLALYMERDGSNYARKLFDETPTRDVRTWTILISGFSKCGNYRIALGYFTEMQKEGIVTPNFFTLSSVLKCCALVENGLQRGKEIHAWMIRNKIDVDVALENALLDFYSKFRYFHYVKRVFELMADKDSISWNIVMAADMNRGNMEESLKSFWRLPTKTVSSWNTMIGCLIQHGHDRNALELLNEMVKVGSAFDIVTFSVSLVLSSSLQNLELGRQIHCHLLRTGINQDSFSRTSLLDMYCKCGEMGKASIIFQELQQESFLRDSMAEAVSWSIMISGFVQHGMIEDAFLCFSSMIHNQLDVDLFTLTIMVRASAHTTCLELGKQIHARTLKSGDVQDRILCSSMIDMYAKSGKLDDAWSFFKQTRNKNIVLWSVMISSYAVHGLGKEAIQLFELMKNDGIIPNEVCFLGLLSACSHAGLVKDGIKYFKMMIEDYGIHPGVEHFACIVDIFGRAGHLEEIQEFVYRSGVHQSREVWKVFLSTCWLQKNVEMTKWISQKIVEMESLGADPCLLISSIYSANQVWEEASNLRGKMLERGVTKLPGQSWICSS